MTRLLSLFLLSVPFTIRGVSVEVKSANSDGFPFINGLKFSGKESTVTAATTVEGSDPDGSSSDRAESALDVHATQNRTNLPYHDYLFVKLMKRIAKKSKHDSHENVDDTHGPDQHQFQSVCPTHCSRLLGDRNEDTVMNANLNHYEHMLLMIDIPMYIDKIKGDDNLKKEVWIPLEGSPASQGNITTNETHADLGHFIHPLCSQYICPCIEDALLSSLFFPDDTFPASKPRLPLRRDVAQHFIKNLKKHDFVELDGVERVEKECFDYIHPWGTRKEFDIKTEKCQKKCLKERFHKGIRNSSDYIYGGVNGRGDREPCRELCGEKLVCKAKHEFYGSKLNADSGDRTLGLHGFV